MVMVWTKFEAKKKDKMFMEEAKLGAKGKDKMGMVWAKFVVKMVMLEVKLVVKEKIKRERELKR